MSPKNSDLILDWNEVTRQIPGCNNPNGPLHVVRSCLQSDQDLDPYDQINKQLDVYVENLQKQFQELTR